MTAADHVCGASPTTLFFGNQHLMVKILERFHLCRSIAVSSRHVPAAVCAVADRSIVAFWVAQAQRLPTPSCYHHVPLLLDCTCPSLMSTVLLLIRSPDVSDPSLSARLQLRRRHHARPAQGRQDDL